MKRMARARSSIHGYEDHEEQVDKISLLPDAVLILILSLVDTKLAVQCSLLCKRWVNLWKWLPALSFDLLVSKNDKAEYARKTLFYENFIDKVFLLRYRLIKVDSVNIKSTSYRLMDRVFRYSISQGIPNLSIDTSELLRGFISIDYDYPRNPLMSLSLKGMFNLGKFLNFNLLVSLRLDRVQFLDAEPFSCFPNLEKLFLVNCKSVTNSALLQVIGLKLSTLSISSCFLTPKPFSKLALVTPKLVFLELDGLIPMPFKTSQLPELNTIYIDCYSSLEHDLKQQKLNLLNIFRSLGNAKRVHLTRSTIELLNLSYDMLAQEPRPFKNLQYLNFIPPPNKPAVVRKSVAVYLLKDCPNAVVNAVYK